MTIIDKDQEFIQFTSKENEGNPHYVLKEEKRFFETRMVHDVLITECLKYIALDRYGRPLS